MPDESLQKRIDELTRENERLSGQVKLMMNAESKLYTLQDNLNAQQRIYVRLAEVGRELNASLDVTKILQTVTTFTVYEFNYERCVAFVEEKDHGRRIYRTRAFEGYYEDDEIAKIKSARLIGDEPALSGINDDPGYIYHMLDDHDAKGDPLDLGQILAMDEYFVFVLERKETGVSGFFAAGNTAQQARYQTRVNPKDEMLVALSNLAGQTAITLANVRSFQALQRERELLDEIVDERTRELSEALDSAQEAVRVKAEFLANVSHELRTPLNSIVNIPTALFEEYHQVEVFGCRGCGSEFQSDGTDEDGAPCPECGEGLTLEQRVICVGDPIEHRRFLYLLGQQGTHLLNLVEDILNFSKLGSGRMELNVTPIDLGELFEEVETTVTTSRTEETAALVFPKVETSLELIADRVKLKQIFINLIGNAVKFTPKDGEIRVGFEQGTHGGEESFYFTVSDTGIGIPEEQLESIFESFRQVDGSHTRTYGGTGLGLAITRQIIELHGGEIWATSEKNKGSTFHFWLPCDQDVQMRAAVSVMPRSASIVPSPSGLGHGNVVVVDDEPAQLSMARKLLEREGYKVQLVSDAPSALKVIQAKRPRFVLLDIMMPEVNGLWLLDELKRDESTKEIPVIVSTAYHYNRKKAEAAGGIWLPKPWSAKRLSAGYLEALVNPDKSSILSSRPSSGAGKPKLADAISKILYVEDEDANWEVTLLSLRGKYDLDRAKNSKEAFELISKNNYDLILMDLQLSGSDLDGVEMTKILSGKRTKNLPDYAVGVTCHAPIVVVTAYASLYKKQDLIASGASDFIAKPVDFTHLLIVLSRLIVKGAVSKLRDDIG